MKENRYETLTGHVEHITYHNEDSGFYVLLVKTPGAPDAVTVVGNGANISPGETIEAEGLWLHDVKYGPQFKAHRLQNRAPQSLTGIRKYLGSGLIKGIGAHFAARLVEAFGTDVFEVIEKTPQRLRELEGIGPKRAAQIQASWAEQKSVRDIMVFLHAHGVGSARAVRIYKTYGDAAIERIKANPYQLAADIWGIGFKTADQLAFALGLDPQSPLRARAGLHHVLFDFSGQGHCGVPIPRLLEAAVALLNIDQTVLVQALGCEIAEGRLLQESWDEQQVVMLRHLHAAENGVALELLRLAQGPRPWPDIEWDKALAWAREQTGKTLSPSQRDAVRAALTQKVFIITGGPGVGKTTVVNTILRILQKKLHRIHLCAPTGRAAKRLSETTGCEAKTIHRLLEFDVKHFRFRYCASEPLPTDMLIVDETSMVDVTLMYQLLQALPDHAAVLLVGDADQLPSVGPGRVLADCLQSEALAYASLTEIFRQAQHSRIIVNAHRINRGDMPVWSEQAQDSDFYFIRADTPQAITEKLLRVVSERIPQRFGFDPITQVQVLSPMNRGELGARALNGFLQERLNRSAGVVLTRFGVKYQTGDKVIQLINNYDKDVFNGDIGRVHAIDPEEKNLTVLFDQTQVNYDWNELDELGLAYAITVHKSQGSEYPAVVLPLATSHYTLLERNLLYTAVTRGKQLVVIIGQSKALGMAVNNRRADARFTRLKHRLRRMLGPRTSV